MPQYTTFLKHHAYCAIVVSYNCSYFTTFVAGRDASEASNTDGSVLKINCDSGYELNLAKKKVRCQCYKTSHDLIYEFS